MKFPCHSQMGRGAEVTSSRAMARGKRQKTDDGEEETLVVFQEGMVRCVVAAKGAKQPGSVPGFCNVKMKVNRDVSVCAVAAAAMERTEREPSLPPMKCIDAFTSSGILGLQWAVESTKVSECNLEVTLNDLAEECCSMAMHNAVGNSQPGDISKPPQVDPSKVTPCRDFSSLNKMVPKARNFYHANVHVTRKPAGSVLHDEPYDFIHLDPFGSAAPHLDAAMSRAPHLSVVSITATDTAALWGIYPAVARRRYGAVTAVETTDADGLSVGVASRRPPWFRELGVRVLLGAIARAAARHDRGIAPLCSLVSDHFVQVTVRVSRGAAAADRSSSDEAIGRFWHCEVCDVAACGGLERPCAHAHSLGPGWLGPLGEMGFLRRMQLAAKWSIDYAKIMKGFVTEPKSAYRDAIEGVSGKTLKLIDRLIAEVDGPPLYRVVSRYSAPGMDPPPMDDVLEALVQGGWRGTRTHLDASGIRTDATPEEIRRIVGEVAARRAGERSRGQPRGVNE